MNILTGNKIRSLVDQAVDELQTKTFALDKLVKFNSSTWELKQDTGMLKFMQKNGIQASAKVQIIGTYNTEDETWLWAWDHPSIADELKKDSKVLYEFGKSHNISCMTTRKILCQESDCWEFTALACKLCNSQGAYRGPAGTVLVFMTFDHVQISHF